MRSLSLIAAALSMGAGYATPPAAPSTTIKRTVRRTLAARGFVPASINRNTGKPHEHTREIARRERQGRPL